MLIVAVLFIGGGVVYLAARALGSQGADRGEEPRTRPLHSAVTSPYHEHTDLTGAGRERDRTTSDTEHQSDG